MAKSIELSPTIKCTNKECAFDIPVIDCYSVVQPDVPQISVRCPECGKVMALSKAKSIAYAKEYPQIQQDIDNAAGYRLPEPDEHESLSDRVIRLLEVYGYTQTKWTAQKRIIRQLIEISPEQHTPATLNEILTSRKIERGDAYQIANLALGKGAQTPAPWLFNQQPMMPGVFPQYPQYPYQQPMMQQPQYPQQQYPQYPQPPQYPQQPVQNQVSPVVQHSSDDEITIVEKLDSDGNVKERIIKQPKAAAQTGSQAPAEHSMVEQFKEMIAVMTNAGMINTTTADDQPQPLTAEGLGAVIATYLDNDNQKPDDDRYDNVIAEMKSLREELARKDKEDMQSQINSLKAEIGKSKGGLSDAQFSENTRKDIETMRIGAVRDTLDQIVKPVMEMQANQSKFQTAMMISQLEQQRNVPAGTYAQIFGTGVSDETVQGDIEKWRHRAEKVGA